MKKYIVVLYILSFSFNGFAQNETTTFNVDGIKVIYKPSVKEIVNVKVYFRGGVNNYPKENTGIENLTLAATTECGTMKYTKDQFKDQADKYGIALGGSSTYDYGVISLNCIAKYFNQGWDLFSEAVKYPVFNSTELANLKGKIISSIRTEASDPDARIEQLIADNAFPNTAYAQDPVGAEENITRFTSNDLKNYYASMLNKNKMFIVVVGKLNRADLENKIRKSFSSIPTHPYQEIKVAPQLNYKNKVFTETRPLATNYVAGSFNAPQMSDPSFVSNRLAITALSGRLFNEIRTRRNLSYAPYATTKVSKMPYSFMYSSTTSPKEVVLLMINELNELKTDGFYESELSGAKSRFVTSNYMQEESTGAIASSIGNAEIMGDWRYAERMPAEVQKVTLEQMNNAINKFAKGITWNYLGNQNGAEAAEGSFQLMVN